MRRDGLDELSAAVARAEHLLDGARYDDALASISSVHIPATSAPVLSLRVLHCEAWARLARGELAAAEALCERGRALSESAALRDDDRAEALFRLGACRLKLGRTSNAASLFGEAIRLGGDRVRARAFEWRARCYVVQREWDAAQADAECALQLADALHDRRLTALAKLQCSAIAERRGDIGVARYYAERARDIAVECGDRETEARSIALLAQVDLDGGEPKLAEEHAQLALSILDGRDEYLVERGNVHLILGRALLAHERAADALEQFAAAEWLFERLCSKWHVAAAWLAQGEAYAAVGDVAAAAELYRRAAQSMQDVHF